MACLRMLERGLGPFIAGKVGSAAAGDKIAGRPLLLRQGDVAMAGAGSVLADRLGDKDGLLTRAAGEELWLGRCRPWQRRTVDVGVPPRGP